MLEHSELIMHIVVTLAATAVFLKVAMEEIKAFFVVLLKIAFLLVLVIAVLLYHHNQFNWLELSARLYKYTNAL